MLWQDVPERQFGKPYIDRNIGRLCVAFVVVGDVVGNS
jgi:hypothetical protein